MRHFVRYSMLFLALFAMHPVLAQQRFDVSGTVLDDHTGMPLAGVQVALQGTVFGAVTAFDGSFLIRGVRPGAYLVVASMLGYERVEREVQVEAESVAGLAFRLHEKHITLDEVIAQGERVYSAASSVALRGFDLRTRPVSSSQDLLRLAPGLVIAQHAGGGKAEQIFLRGFDADHGTDVAISFDGMPVNMVSHGHGQGYADLHFIIPETVEEVGVWKGPYFASQGNLATAGAVGFKSRDHFDENLVRIEGGTFNTGSFTSIYQIPLEGEHKGAYVAAQLYGTDGPVSTPQGLRRANLFGKFHTHLSAASTLAISVGGFSSAWDASGQIPQRAVDQGLITRFEALDDLEGGSTNRQDVNLTYEVLGADGTSFLLQTYTSRYRFKLFSNFTFFLEDSEFGDMIEQTDDRRITGLNSRYRRVRNMGDVVSTTMLGGGFRADDAAVGLLKSPDRFRSASLVDSDVAERNVFFWVQEEILPVPWFRAQFGLRADYFTFDVEDHLENVEGAALPHASGYAQRMILSPKLNLAVEPAPGVEVFGNFGTGFHSNDARSVILGERVLDLVSSLRRRGATTDEIDAILEAGNFDATQRNQEDLPRATGAEVGLAVAVGRHARLTAAAWLLDLEQEYVYVGDGGFTELSGATRRVGVDLEARIALLPWLWADADVNLAKGWFVDEPEGEDNIPLAPRMTATGGFGARHPSGWEANLRMRHIGSRPANEDNSVRAEGYTLFDIVASVPVRQFRFHVTLENLLDVEWNEAQFDTESRLRGEIDSVSELHFTPGNPRNIRIGVGYRF